MCDGSRLQRVSVIPVSTFSIVALDPETGAFGIAVASRFFDVGGAVPWAEAGVGAVATQSFVEPGYGPRALEMLRHGREAAETLKALVEADPARELRQVAILDANGSAAAHTGALCIPFAGHRVAAGRSVQGNLLASDRVCGAMDQAFDRARGPFASRLLEALEAGHRAGGDARGMQSAALLVVREVSCDEPWRNRVVDLTVEDHRRPIAELRRLMRLRSAFDAVDAAQTALREGRFDEARASFAEGMRLSRGHDEILFWAGIAFTALGDPEEGLRQLRAALRKNPRWRQVLGRLPPGLAPPEAVLRKLRARRGGAARGRARP